jgi:type II secretory pathway pseudopilin PulG
VIGRRFRDESGVTLVETVVVVSLLGIVLAFVLQSVASYQSAATGGIRRLENLDEARLLMEVLTKDVRTAVRLNDTTAPFVVNSGSVTYADDTSVRFYANLNLTTACPKIVWIHVVGLTIKEDIYEPSSGTPQDGNCAWASYPGTPTRTRIVGQYVANTASEPLFTYYWDNAGTLTPYNYLTETPLSTTNALRVTAVQIRLSIKKTTALPVNRTTIVNRVRLPNIYYNPAPSPS